MSDPKDNDINANDELDDDALDDVAGGAVDIFLKNTIDGVKSPDGMMVDASTPKARCGIAYQCPE